MNRCARIITTPMLVLSLLLGCIDTSSVLSGGVVNGQAAALLAKQGRLAFANRFASRQEAERAFWLMEEAARTTPVDDPSRIERLSDAARMAIWLARHTEDADAKTGHADSALLLSNTVVRDAPDRVDGYYFRAVAVGLIAQVNSLYGPDAMGQIRNDARRAIEIAPHFESAGPHRILGALYLHAPGPPAGVGSLRRAVRELEAAVRIAPYHPANALFLCRAYIEDGRFTSEYAKLMERLPAMIESTPEEADRVLWRRELEALKVLSSGRGV